VTFQIPCGQNSVNDVRLQSMVFTCSKSESLNCHSSEARLQFVTKSSSAQLQRCRSIVENVLLPKMYVLNLL
jgi:hypothetical protein